MCILFQERSSLLKRLGSIKVSEFSQSSSGNNELEEPVSITGLETFSLSYKVFYFPWSFWKSFPLLFGHLVCDGFWFWFPGPMAPVYSFITKSPYKVSVNFSISLSLQTCWTSTLWSMASASSMAFGTSLYLVWLHSAPFTLLCSILQGVRALNTRGTAISRSSLLCRSMLKFIDSLLHYLTFEAGFTFP